ncbi:MAG: hypothetical protein HYR94_08320 [Chloroflexi bacterium]|nr:hypothetical protein [Chloroflexota bacterium]
MVSKPSEPHWVLWLEWAVLIAIVALATFLRYWRLGEVPPGFNSDEAVGAMGGLTILREGLRYSYEGQGGGGALGFYFVAASFYLFGPSIAAARGLAAWAGVVSVLANYWAVREVFRLEGLTRARILAGLSTLGLAASFWHIQASRVVFAGIGVPFLMLPSVYFLWLGLNHHTKHWPFVVSGIFLAGLMYIYLSGVFAAPFYAAFFITQWLIIKFWQKPPNLKSQIPKGHNVSNLKSNAQQSCQALRQYARAFPIGQARAWLWQGLYHWLSGQPARAYSAWQKSLAAAERLTMPYEQALALYEMGRHLPAAEPKRRAYLSRAAEGFEQLDAAYDLARVRQALAGPA